MTTAFGPRQVLLADGRHVTLRLSRPEDEHRLTAYLEALDPESRRLRFHQPVPLVKPWLVRPLVAVDQSDHVALLAWSECRVVGEARFVRLRHEPDAAEVAFSVAGDHRRVGLGRGLLDALAALASTRGITTFTSSVTPDNRASAGLLTAIGTRFTIAGGALEGRGPVPAPARPARLAA